MSEGFHLIVAEKPSVARDIARVLKVGGGGKGWLGNGALRVTWCVGHLVELAEPQRYNPAWKTWRLELLPMLPERFELAPRKSGRDQWKVVKKLMTDPALVRVINACDAGREGELIFAFTYELAGCDAPVERLWISSMTDSAIRDGFASLRPGEQMKALEAAARSRAESDWLVGLNATRAMTVRMRSGASSALLSLGRVQTPTLALIEEREHAIKSFVPETFWQVKATFGRKDGDEDKETWEAVWTGRDSTGKKLDRLFDKERAEELLAAIAGREGTVSKVERKTTREKPPLLYDLTNLQKEANKRFGFSAKKTLDVAQKLYEQHKVSTYPRTDARHLGSDQKDTLPPLFETLRFGPYQKSADEIIAKWPFEPGSRVIDDAEVSDHHAIIPTGVDPRNCPLTVDEKRVFDLIARRFLAVFLDDATFAAAVLETMIDEELFLAKGKTLLEAGWRAIDPPASEKKKKGKPPPPMLPPVEEGEIVDQVANRLQEGVTKPPKRYTEATLLGAMERAGEALDEKELKRAMKRKGLGTPATRASIIETLLSRGYIKREKKNLVPTEQGSALLAALPVEVLRSPRLTGEWEARLNAIADGEESREDFMADIRAFAQKLVEELKQAEVDKRVQNTGPASNGDGEVLGACPKCGAEVREGPRGWGCSGCSLMVPGKVARRTISKRLAKQLLKEGETPPVKGFKSKAGKEFRAALALDDDGNVVFRFPQPDSLGECPGCGKAVRLRGKYYTCDSGRDCSFIIPKNVRGRDLSSEEIEALLREGKTPVLRGFQQGEEQQRGEFSAIVRWTGSKVVVTEIDPRTEAGPVGKCPRCGGGVSYASNAWRCSGCGFSVPGRVASRDLAAEDIRDLLEEGRTKRLYGFRQRSGKPFKAALTLDERQSVRLDFSKGDDERRPIPPGGPRPAFGEPVDCPVCLDAGETEPGYIVAGREAWGCSRWREGCTLRVPFEIHGTPIPEDEAKRLFGKQRATRFLEEPIGPPGKRKQARIILKTKEEPCWVIEPKRPSRRR